MSEPIPSDVALRFQLALIAGREPDTSFFELRPFDRDGLVTPDERVWLPVSDVACATKRIADQAARLNVMVGAAPRVKDGGGRVEHVDRCWCLWADCDGSEAVERLWGFEPPPTLVVRTSDDRRHAYWALNEAIPPTWAKRANRRLALALGADRAATDAARILRAVGTWNHKRTPPYPVTCTLLETAATYGVTDVVGPLPDDSAYTARPRPMSEDPAVSGSSRALDGLARTVAQAQEGNRNALLNWASYRAGEHVAIGSIGETMALEALRSAALQTGLPEAEADRTIASGLAAGKAVA